MFRKKLCPQSQGLYQIGHSAQAIEGTLSRIAHLQFAVLTSGTSFPSGGAEAVEGFGFLRSRRWCTGKCDHVLNERIQNPSDMVFLISMKLASKKDAYLAKPNLN